ncbi:HAL/PAL/TAL family ammonia-lyase [Aliamphritea hakodatensis]|uniref:HAL/PAL/TAL family ammonia-lyase n=1 Tax=Aliamphritea hakodatensis TaxID=2895352 RepID=UPI0022FDA85A|nr:histidine ammonia-lyase [Aliamphritea hakodatensis]
MQAKVIFDQRLCWQDLLAVADGATLDISEERWQRMARARSAVIDMVERGERAYGITTGLGDLCNHLLAPAELAEMSRGTILNHACGVGPVLERRQVRAIMAAAIANYSHGYSGISPDIVTALLAMLNNGVTPQVPEQGSVGYLTHMAHIALPLLGVGEVEYQGQLIPATEAFQQADIQVPEIGPKDGLSLVNGTPCMTGLACLVAADSEHLLGWSDLSAALSFEACGGQLAALGAANLALKASPQVSLVGRRLRGFLKDSRWLESRQGQRTQDALSLRSIPQIQGACRQQWQHFSELVNRELNAATDNPLILEEDGGYRVVSQANPHGESLALASDGLAPALAELTSAGERRTYRLLNPQISGLPGYLTDEGGISSGLMIVQYVSASLSAENRRHAQPVSVDNYVTSGLQEDHLSFGTSAVLRLFKQQSNLQKVLAIELMCAAQAFDFIAADHPQDKHLFSRGGQLLWQRIRQHIPHYTRERWVAKDIQQLDALLADPEVLQALEHQAGIGDTEHV